MTIYHTLLELLKPYTPGGVKAVHLVLESHTQAFYPEGYAPAEVLPGVEADGAILPELATAFQAAVLPDGLERSCIEARRALGELVEKIGVQL